MLKKYLVERNTDGVGQLSGYHYTDMAKKSNKALDRLGPGIQWNESIVTDDKLYDVYLAESEELIREHARISGFPVSDIKEIKRMMDPSTASESGWTQNPPGNLDEEIYDSIL